MTDTHENSGAQANAGSQFGAAASHNPSDVIGLVQQSWQASANRFNEMQQYFEHDDRMSVENRGEGIRLQVTNYKKPDLNLMSMELQFDAQRGYVLSVAAQKDPHTLEPARPVQEKVFAASAEGLADMAVAAHQALEQDFPGVSRAPQPEKRCPA